MAYIVRRLRGGFEVRESALTPRGPRSRTLASFSLLTEDVVARVRARSADPPDAEALRSSAVRAGAPVAAARGDTAALTLIAELAAGRPVAPGLRHALLVSLEGDDGGDALRWATATDEERGRALRDLLLLADRIPRRRRGPLRFPHLKLDTA
jgi:fermentation-respiration switch protein FrsA (DUF1100 family)